MCMEKKSYSHILQKVGILKNFTVAKIVNKKEMSDLRKLIRSVATDDVEYEKILREEIKKIANMHDDTNPIPGIIYPKDNVKLKKLLFGISKKFCEGTRTLKLNKNEMAFLITAIINNLGLTQEDFVNLKQNLEEESDTSTKNPDDDEDDDDRDDRVPPTG